MKRTLSLSIIMLVLLSGCSFKLPFELNPKSSAKEAAPKNSAPSSQDSPAPEESSSIQDSGEITPDKAAEKLLENISDLDEAQIRELAGEYFSGQPIPDAYYSVLKPISERVSYKIGSYKIDGDSAMVDVEITAVDAQSALNNIMPGALAHLAVMQMTGKDISNPEKILAEYAAQNIDWDKLPTVKTNATLYLVKGADDEWKVDASNPDNLGFANAISGGAIEVAQNLKSFAERFQ